MDKYNELLNYILEKTEWLLNADTEGLESVENFKLGGICVLQDILRKSKEIEGIE